MIIIKNNDLDLKTLVDVINYQSLVEELTETLKEYIVSHQQRVVINGSVANVFHISGLSSYHHENFADYLNRTILKNTRQQAHLTPGHFAHYPSRHHWLQIDDLILDLAISQFKNKPLPLLDTIPEARQTHCFISDNPRNYLYNLYAAANI